MHWNSFSLKKLHSTVYILCGHSFFHPGHNDFQGFPSRILSIKFFCPILILCTEPVLSFKCWVLNKGTTDTIFKTFLVWCGPWLGTEPGTSSTLPLGYQVGSSFSYEWHQLTSFSFAWQLINNSNIICFFVYRYIHKEQNYRC